jgi:hypothetical protein
VKLWLDDERPAPEGWEWVTSAQTAIQALGFHQVGMQTITHMSFDHDLADVHYSYWHLGHNPDWKVPHDDPRRVLAREESAKEMTGYDVLLWMAENKVWPTEACYVHTHNSARANAMCGVINRYGPYDQPVRWTPYRSF